MDVETRAGSGKPVFCFPEVALETEPRRCFWSRPLRPGRAQRDAKIAEIDAQRDNFWQRRIEGILERGVAEGVFRRKLDCETVALAIMVQCKGVAQHAAMRHRKARELTALVEEIARQVETRVVREAAGETNPRKK